MSKSDQYSRDLVQQLRAKARDVAVRRGQDMTSSKGGSTTVEMSTSKNKSTGIPGRSGGLKSTQRRSK